MWCNGANTAPPSVCRFPPNGQIFIGVGSSRWQNPREIPPDTWPGQEGDNKGHRLLWRKRVFIDLNAMSFPSDGAAWPFPQCLLTVCHFSASSCSAGGWRQGKPSALLIFRYGGRLSSRASQVRPLSLIESPVDDTSPPQQQTASVSLVEILHKSAGYQHHVCSHQFAAAPIALFFLICSYNELSQRLTTAHK